MDQQKPLLYRGIRKIWKMKKIILGIVIGVVLTLSIQYAWRYFQYRQFKDSDFLFCAAKYDLEHRLKGARVLDVSIGPNSKATVNYIYGKLYDVNIAYERDGIIKSITVQYGKTKGTWISPNNTDFEILDDKAEIIYKKSSATK